MQSSQAIFSSVDCLSVPCFSTLSYKRYDIGRKRICEYKMYMEDKEEDVGSYWMTLRKGEDTLI